MKFEEGAKKSKFNEHKFMLAFNTSLWAQSLDLAYLFIIGRD